MSTFIGVGDCEVLVEGDECGEPAVGKCAACQEFVCVEHGIMDDDLICEGCGDQRGLRPMRSL